MVGVYSATHTHALQMYLLIYKNGAAEIIWKLYVYIMHGNSIALSIFYHTIEIVSIVSCSYEDVVDYSGHKIYTRRNDEWLRCGEIGNKVIG